MLAFLSKIREEEAWLAQRLCITEDSHRPWAPASVVTLTSVATSLKLLLSVLELVQPAIRATYTRALAFECRALGFIAPKVNVSQVIGSVDIAIGMNDAIFFEPVPWEYRVKIKP